MILEIANLMSQAQTNVKKSLKYEYDYSHYLQSILTTKVPICMNYYFPFCTQNFRTIQPVILYSFSDGQHYRLHIKSYFLFLLSLTRGRGGGRVLLNEGEVRYQSSNVNLTMVLIRITHRACQYILPNGISTLIKKQKGVDPF